MPSCDYLSTGAVQAIPFFSPGPSGDRAHRATVDPRCRTQPALAREQHSLRHGGRECPLPPLPRQRRPRPVPGSARRCRRAVWLGALCLVPPRKPSPLRRSGRTGGALSRDATAQGVYAMRFHRRHHTSGHLFKRPYDSRPILTHDHLYRSCGYTLRNAVRHGFVERAEDWEWSSFRTTARLAPAPRRHLACEPFDRLLQLDQRLTTLTSCAPTCERTASTRDDPGVDVLIEGFDADAIALARLLGRRGQRGSPCEPGARAPRGRRAAGARDRRPPQRRPRCGSGRGRDRVPRRLDARGGAPGRQAPCSGRARLVPRRPGARALEGSEHRHHRNRGQDDDDRSRRLDPPPCRRRHRRQQGRAGPGISGRPPISSSASESRRTGQEPRSSSS